MYCSFVHSYIPSLFSHLYSLVSFLQMSRVEVSDVKVRFDKSKSTVYEAFSGSDCSGSASEESESPRRHTPPPSSTKRRSVSRPADPIPKRRGPSRPRPDEQDRSRYSTWSDRWPKPAPTSSVVSHYTQVTQRSGPYTDKKPRDQAPSYHHQKWKESKRDNGSDYNYYNHRG